MTKPTCYLTVLSPMTPAQIAELAPLLEAMRPGDTGIAEELATNPSLAFESVFEGDMAMNTVRWFSQAKISFTWEWEAYDSVGAGMNFFDAEEDHLHILRIHEQLVVIPIDQIESKDVVERTQHAVARLKELKA